MKNITLLLTVMIVLLSCSSDDDKASEFLISVTNSQHWDEQDYDVTIDDFGTTEYINANGEVLKIQKIRYLISKVILTNSFGDEIEIGDYRLVDLTDVNSLSYAQNIVVPPGTYTSISFVYGFNEEDNIDQEYADLNTASWNWPGMLGGGYHFMQFEGTFTNSTTLNPLPFAYHNGTARVTDGVFEQNFITVNVNGLSIDSNTTIDIKMNLAEWFKNPNTWDLNLLGTNLMGNYDAQKMMNQNGQSVFTVSVEE
ncbi:MAG: hypothetical protein ACI93P_001183 [bacterium]|jgi:hypothetical protein